MPRLRSAGLAFRAWAWAACLAWLGFLWLVVRTWAARNDGWLEYILCRASFAAMTGLVVSTPFRELVNTLGGRLLRGQLADATSSAKDESAKREVKVTKYTWEDDGSFIRITVPVEPSDMEYVTDESEHPAASVCG